MSFRDSSNKGNIFIKSPVKDAKNKPSILTMEPVLCGINIVRGVLCLGSCGTFIHCVPMSPCSQHLITGCVPTVNRRKTSTLIPNLNVEVLHSHKY